jgi:hypothetical protein
MTGNSVNVGPVLMLDTCNEREISGRDVASNIKATLVTFIFLSWFMFVIFKTSLNELMGILLTMHGLLINITIIFAEKILKL